MRRLSCAILAALPLLADDTWARQHRVDDIFAALEAKAGGVYADIGAGEGRYALRLARIAARVIAVDVSESRLATLRGRAAKEAVQNVETRLGTAQSPALDPRSLDGAIVVNAYHEFREPEKMLDGIRDALRPGAPLVLVDALPRRVGVTREQQTGGHTIAAEIARAEVEAAGFRVERFEARFLDNDDNGKSRFLIVARPQPSGSSR